MRIPIILSLLLIAGNAVAQDSTEDEVWYVWLDAQLTVDGKQIRLVSEEPFAITCCIKSPDYARIEKDAARWIREHYDPTYEGRISLKKIQDSELANSVISWAKKDAENGKDVLVVEYLDDCKASS